MQGLRIFAAALLALVLTANAEAKDEFKIFDRFSQDSETRIDNSAYAAFLSAYTATDDTGIVLVKYAAAKADPQAVAQLNGYIESLEAIDPTQLNKDEAFAYWGNLYNAVTVKVILDNYPVKSIRDIKSGLVSLGPWGRKLATVNGQELSLNNIEHDILREFWDEPRVHYVVNCASIGCPNLSQTPWTGADLDARLTEAARGYINHPRGVSVRNGRITASSIYNWYGKDFGGNDASKIAHWREYAEPELLNALEGVSRIRKYDYDWSLNEQK